MGARLSTGRAAPAVSSSACGSHTCTHSQCRAKCKVVCLFIHIVGLGQAGRLCFAEFLLTERLAVRQTNSQAEIFPLVLF